MQSSFLSESVAFLLARYNGDLAEVHVLLPTRRSRLFFNLELAKRLTGRPVWQPRFRSVDEMMEEAAGLKTGEKLTLLTELYNVYSRYHTEPFDKFYFWGDMLLSDFDAVDNYMIDAGILFRNSGDLAEIDRLFDYLEPEQREVLHAFWQNFRGSRPSDEKNSFYHLWDTLLQIYTEYRQRLREVGIGYKGMVYREAAERIAREGSPFAPEAHFAVVGFNALSTSEKVLFKALKKEHDADFLWDSDDYYAKDKRQEAGLFIRQNIRLLGESNPAPARDHFTKKKTINIIESPSDSLQCKYVWNFLEELNAEAEQKGEKLGRETAVVLTDESLLMPLLSSIPPLVEHFNVTLGYELRLSQAYTLIELLIELQSNRKRDTAGTALFYYKDIENLLAHPYVTSTVSGKQRDQREAFIRSMADNKTLFSDCRELNGDPAAELFREITDWKAMQEYLTECLASLIRPLQEQGTADRTELEILRTLHRSIVTLGRMVERAGIGVSLPLFVSALRKHLRQEKIPFEGEPLVGVQVMGILETRALDFDHVLLLSVNEENFPSNVGGHSYLPPNLRIGFGLPTQNYHEAMYAYYFYRLLQRAKRVDILYLSKNEGMVSNEPSRFIQQLRYTSPHEVNIRNLSLNLFPPAEARSSRPKEAKTLRLLDTYLSGKRKLSPSALFDYIACPMKFYFGYVEGIRIAEEREAEAGAKELGNATHNTLETIYKELIGLSAEGVHARLTLLLDHWEEEVAPLIDRTIDREFALHGAEPTGHLHNLREFVRGYVRNILTYDRDRGAVFTVEAVEEPVEGRVTIGGDRRVSFFGYADRIDFLASGIRAVIDYKSGSPKSTRSIEQLFDTSSAALNKPAMQSLLYALLLRQKKETEVAPMLYFARQMVDKEYDPAVDAGGKIHRISDAEAAYTAALTEKLEELFDPKAAFTCTSNNRLCEFCDYRKICKTEI